MRNTYLMYGSYYEGYVGWGFYRPHTYGVTPNFDNYVCGVGRGESLPYRKQLATVIKNQRAKVFRTKAEMDANGGAGREW